MTPDPCERARFVGAVAELAESPYVVDYAATFTFAATPEQVWAVLERFETLAVTWPWLRELRVDGAGLQRAPWFAASSRPPLPYQMRLVVVLDECAPGNASTHRCTAISRVRPTSRSTARRLRDSRRRPLDDRDDATGHAPRRAIRAPAPALGSRPGRRRHCERASPAPRRRALVTREPNPIRDGCRHSNRRIAAMPVDASSTREKLIDEAARAFAEHGVYGASLIDITRRAGPAQPGRAALPLRVARRRAVRGARASRRLPRSTRGRAARDRADEARRRREVGRRGDRAPRHRAGRERLARPLLPRDPRRARRGGSGRVSTPTVADALARTGGYAVYDLLAARMADVDRRGRARALRTGHRVHPARGRRSGPRARSPRPPRAARSSSTDAFVANLVTMVAAGMSAPLIESVDISRSP